MRNEDATSSDPGENRGDSQDMQYQDQAVGVEEEAPVQAELVDEPDLDLDVTRTLMSLSRFSCDPHDFEEEEDD